MEERVFRTTKAERWGFALFMAGQGIVNTFVGSFWQLYLTDIGIAAIALGVMFLITRVWDAINDPIFGAILDKIHLKSGKFIPFLRASNILLPIATILLFAVPTQLSMGGKLAWAFVAYLLYDIAYTICDVPIFAMTSAATDQVHERINIMSRNTVLSTVTIIIVSIVVPQMYPGMGGFLTSVILAISAAILMFFMSKFAKERYIDKSEDVSMKDMLSYIKENKYMRIGFLGIMILSVTNMMNAVAAYFAVNCLGSLSMVTVLTLFSVIPALIIGVLMPTLTKRFDKFQLLMTGVIGQMILSVIIYFIGYKRLTLFLILMAVRSIFFGLQLVLQLQFTGDFVEYGEYTTGKRLQGIAYSIQTFVFKFMNAVPGSIALIILGLFGFVSGDGAVQPDSAISAIWALFILSSVVGGIISLPIFAQYKLRDKTVQIMAAVNSGEMTRAEGEKLLEGKF